MLVELISEANYYRLLRRIRQVWDVCYQLLNRHLFAAPVCRQNVILFVDFVTICHQ